MFKDTYWKESSLTLSPNQCFNHRKTWMKQLVNKLTVRYYFLTAVLSRNIIISLSAWNSKSGSGSKWLKIMKLVTCVLSSLLVCSVIFLSSLWLHFTSDFLSLSRSISLPHPAPVFSSSQRDPGSCRWVCGCRLSGRRGLHQPSERDWQAGGGRLGQHGSGVSDCGSHSCLQLLSTWTPPPELLCLSQKPLPQRRSMCGHAERIQVRKYRFSFESFFEWLYFTSHMERKWTRQQWDVYNRLPLAVCNLQQVPEHMQALWGNNQTQCLNIKLGWELLSDKTVWSSPCTCT